METGRLAKVERVVPVKVTRAPAEGERIRERVVVRESGV